VQWTTAGPVFAVVDTGVITTVSLVVSSDVVNVQNPEAIAAATAAQLLANGVPNVLTEKVALNATVVPLVRNGGAQRVDVHTFETLIIAQSLALAPLNLTLSWGELTPTGQRLQIAGPDFVNGESAIIPVRTGNVTVTNNDTVNDAYFIMIGTNRASITPRSSLNGYTLGFEGTTSAFTAVAGQTYGIPTNIGQIFQGDADIVFYVGGSNTVKGLFYAATVIDNSGSTVNQALTDTGESIWHALGSQQQAYKRCYLPIGPYTLGFSCLVGGFTQLTISALPAS
jgi:hypothetical protein